MTKEKEIEKQIKQEMLVIQAKMERLQAWKDSGYGQPCVEHTWQLLNNPEIILGTNPKIYILKFKCNRCGMAMQEQASVVEETLYDEWQEFREGGEEE
jgi:hypothetical protein